MHYRHLSLKWTIDGGNALISLQSTVKQEEADASRVNELRTVGHCGGSEVKNDIKTVQFLTQTDCFVASDLNVSSRAAGLNLVLSVYVFFPLKAMSSIDCHYMTDRLQRFELKILVCVLLKKQSHLHLGCPRGTQININIFIFEWTIPLSPICKIRKDNDLNNKTLCFSSCLLCLSTVKSWQHILKVHTLI